MLSSPCSVISQSLCYRLPAQSSSKVCAIVSLLCHQPKFVLSSPCSVISQSLCSRLPALSSSPRRSVITALRAVLYHRSFDLSSPPAVLSLPCFFIVYNYVLMLQQRIKSTTPVSICLCLPSNLSSFIALPSPIIHPAWFSLS